MRNKLITIIEEYYYDTEEERENHSKKMIECGYEDSMQVREDVNKSFQNPKYEWYGRYYKYKEGANV